MPPPHATASHMPRLAIRQTIRESIRQAICEAIRQTTRWRERQGLAMRVHDAAGGRERG